MRNSTRHGDREERLKGRWTQSSACEFVLGIDPHGFVLGIDPSA